MYLIQNRSLVFALVLVELLSECPLLNQMMLDRIVQNREQEVEDHADKEVIPQSA